RLEARAVGRAELAEPVVERPADRRGEIGLQAVDADPVRAARAKDDREVDPFPVHRLKHRARVVTRKIFGRVLVAPRRQVAGARLLAADAAEAPPLRAVEEG